MREVASAFVGRSAPFIVAFGRSSGRTIIPNASIFTVMTNRADRGRAVQAM